MEQSFVLPRQVPRPDKNRRKEKVHVETEHEKLLKGYAAFRKKVSDNKMELQEHRDMVNIFFDEPGNEEKVAESKERIKEIEFWLVHEMPSEELEQIRLFEEAGYVPWTNTSGEISFLKNSPEDMLALSEKETLSLYRSWQNAGQQMIAEIQCIDERLRQARAELGVQKFERITDSLDRLAENQEKWLSVSLEMVIEDFLREQKRLTFLLEGLQEFMDELLPVAKKFGYASDKSGYLVKQETVQ